jgi:hypothetical protein
MLVLNHSLLNKEYVPINALKALASIIFICSLHVIFVPNSTPIYFTLFRIPDNLNACLLYSAG